MKRVYEKAGIVASGAALASLVGLAIAHSREGGEAPRPATAPTGQEHSHTGTKETRRDMVKNLALLVKPAGSEQLELHTQPNAHSRVAGTVQPGEAALFMRPVTQLNKQNYWIGAVTGSGDKPRLLWLDSSKGELTITPYVPDETAPENVKIRFDGQRFTSGGVEGPVATLYGPAAPGTLVDRYVQAWGFAPTDTD